MDVEAVREGEGGAGAQIALDVVLPDRGLMLVGREDHQDVGPFGRFLVRQHLEAGALRLGGRSRAGAERDGNFLHAAVTQVLRMGMALRAIAEDGDLLAGDQVQIGVAIVIDTH